MSDVRRDGGVKAASVLGWVCIAVLILGLILPLRFELRAAASAQDEGLLLVYPSQMLHGAVPNHSFESVYGAASLWAVAGAFKLFGSSVTTERLVGLLYWVILAGSLGVLVGRRRGVTLGALAGILSVYLVTGAEGLTAAAWVGAVAFGSLGLVLLDSAERRHKQQGALLAAAGTCFGLAISYRIDLALAVGLVVVLILIVWRWRVWPVLLGMAIGLIPLVLNMAQAGVTSVIRGELIEPIFVSGPGRHLPLSYLQHSGQLVLVLCVLAVLGLIAGGLTLLKRGESAIVLAVGLFDLGLLPQAFQRSDFIHITYVACVLVPTALMIPYLTGLRPVWGLIVTVILLIIVSPLVFKADAGAAAKSLGLRPDPEYLVTNDGRSVPVNSLSDERNLNQLLATVDRLTMGGQRIFVGPSDLRRTNYNDIFIYFLLPHLNPGSYYLEMEPGVANGSSSHLAQDIRSDNWLILSSRWNTSSEPNASQHYGSSAANLVVASEFRIVRQYGPWRLFAQKKLRCPQRARRRRNPPRRWAMSGTKVRI